MERTIKLSTERPVVIQTEQWERICYAQWHDRSTVERSREIHEIEVLGRQGSTPCLIVAANRTPDGGKSYWYAGSTARTLEEVPAAIRRACLRLKLDGSLHDQCVNSLPARRL